MGDAVLARLRCGATIVDPEGRTVGSLPLQPAGEITALAATSTIAPKWHLDLLGGITTTGSAEAGIAWTGRGRIGAYALAEHAMAKRDETDPTWRAHLGFRWRIR